MSNHDPMCPKYGYEFREYCECGLIRRVREDTLNAARDAVAALPKLGRYGPPERSTTHIGRADALAAIDAQRGESNG